jgi:hypothetical protein
MLTDAILNTLVPPGAPLSLVGAAGESFPSGLIDLLGLGAGVPPRSAVAGVTGGLIIGNVATFGQPGGMAVGKRPELNVTIGTSLATSDSCTLNAALQAAPDSGAGGGYQPGAWQTIAETGPLTAAQCPAGTVIMRFPWLPPFPANLRPRFLRILFQTASGLLFTAGTIASAVVTTTRDDQFNRNAANNYVVG